MKKKLFNLFLIFCLVYVFSIPVTAQSEVTTTEEELSVENQLDNLLAGLSSTQKALRKDRRKRSVARKIKLITNKLIKAVNLVPPRKCMDVLRVAMDEFYELVSNLGSGISCGPPILPPFLPGEDFDSLPTKLTQDCLPPPDEPLERLQIGGPFGGSFSGVYPLYEDARDLFQIDSNDTEISDVCEDKEEHFGGLTSLNSSQKLGGHGRFSIIPASNSLWIDL